MARFLGSVQGSRGEATRLGTPNSGMSARVQGWRSGVRVEAYAEGDEDVFVIHSTGGSNGSSSEVTIGTVKLQDEELKFIPAKMVRGR